MARSREAEYLDTGDVTEIGTALANGVRELLGEQTNVQALALARLLRGRESTGVHIATEPFDLPDGYWAVEFLRDGFTCGIAPDGSVSS